MGTTAIESPQLRPARSMPSKAFAFGKSAAINVYPGRKSTKGNPRIIRKMLEGKKVMIIMSRTARAFSSSSSF